MIEGRGAAAPLVYLTLFLILTVTFVAGQDEVKGGYYVGGTSSLLPSSGLDASLYTHLFYAFAGLASNKSNVVLSAQNVQEVSTFSSEMKNRNPAVLTLISIQATGAEFAVVLKSNRNGQTFINSSISLARFYHFDGIDMDWEFARSQDDMDAFGLFVAQWRQAVIAEGNRTNRAPLLLTAAVYFDATVETLSYPIAAMANNLDFINVMAYDYHGSWDVSHTGANTNLFDNTSVINTDHGISSWLSAGMPPKKLVLGLTLYGRSWTLRDENTGNGLGAAAIAVGPAQPLSNTAGIFYYSEVIPFIAANNATVVHDMTEVTGYCYAQNVWVSYEDAVIVGTKVLYSKAKGLRGYFFWQVSQDDNFQVSSAASQTWDSGVIPTSPVSAEGASRAASSTVFVVTALLTSFALLLSANTIDIVGY